MHNEGTVRTVRTASAFLALIIAAAGCVSKSRDQQPAVSSGTKPSRKMVRGPDGISFVPPEGFENRTTFKYADPAERQIVEIGYGNLHGTTNTAAAVLAERVDEIEDLKERAPDLVIGQQEDTRIGPVSGRMFRYAASEEHYRFQEWIAVALLDDVSYVQIAYEASALDQWAPRKLQRILDSVAFSEQHLQTAPAGFIRYQAGRISLDIPEKLDPPWDYTFVSPDDQMRLEFSVYDAAHRSRQPPRDNPKDKPPAGTEVTGFEENSIAVGNSPASVLRYILTERVKGNLTKFAMYRADVRLPNATTLIITGRSPHELEGVLKPSFMQLLGSVRKSE